MITNPALLDSAKAYFTNVQTKEVHYESFIADKDAPSIFLNKAIMENYREKMRPFYYNPAKYKTYLEQLGINYPTLEPVAGR
jgi:aminobenzoyl-glutamate utilization protein B